jgi:hypothetical protein
MRKLPGSVLFKNSPNEKGRSILRPFVFVEGAARLLEHVNLGADPDPLIELNHVGIHHADTA